MTGRHAKAPYEPGDYVKALYGAGDGTRLGLLKVERVTRLDQTYPQQWMIVTEPRSGTRQMFKVKADGHDSHDYVSRPTELDLARYLPAVTS